MVGTMDMKNSRRIQRANQLKQADGQTGFGQSEWWRVIDDQKEWRRDPSDG